MDVQHVAVSEVSINMVADKGHCSFESCGVLTGVCQKERERSLNLIQKRVNNFKSIITQIVKYSLEQGIVVIFNPVGILTFGNQKYFPSFEVM